jgi:hypothetical protein
MSSIQVIYFFFLEAGFVSVDSKLFFNSTNSSFNNSISRRKRVSSISAATNIFSFTELLYIIRDFIFVIFVNDHGIDISMKTYMINNNFSQNTINKIDLMCRSFDGGGCDKISLNQFINITIQTLLYSVYIPKIPNDEGLFKYWKKYLEINHVNFIINNGVKDIVANKNIIEKVI